MRVKDTGGSFNPAIDPHQGSPKGSMAEEALQNGIVHLGHRPIGYGADIAASPLFTTISLRDPVSHLKSLYSFKLDVHARAFGFHHDEVMHLRAEQKRLKKT
jgi:hypothetical protein